MIKLTRPAKPKILSTKGEQATKQLKTDYDNGKRNFRFDKEIYGHESVKKSVRNAQYDKCCYCESKEEIGDIEHFRNKSHYYWLAYDWDNLLFCCPTCNRSFKRSEFPLDNEANKAQTHHQDISKEEPLLVNPYPENPEDFIDFKGITIFSKNNKGKTTIATIGLDRPFIDERKLERYNNAKLIFKIYQSLNTTDTKRQELKNLLDELKSDSSEFAQMFRCAFRDEFKY